jgi:Uma2 family endonuclease
VPVLAVEVLSPTDRYGKTLKRVRQFFKAGIVLVWVVDPEDRTVTVHRSATEPRIYEVGEDQVIPLAKLVRELMESALNLKVPLEVSVETGYNWQDMKEWA